MTKEFQLENSTGLIFVASKYLNGVRYGVRIMGSRRIYVSEAIYSLLESDRELMTHSLRIRSFAPDVEDLPYLGLEFVQSLSNVKARRKK